MGYIYIVFGFYTVKMSPKKKTCIAPDIKQGTRHQYIIDTFSVMSVGGELLNGHVLYKYLENCSNSNS